jgi:hypothetical protein
MAHIDHTRILSGEQLDDGIVDTLVSPSLGMTDSRFAAGTTAGKQALGCTNHDDLSTSLYSENRPR